MMYTLCCISQHHRCDGQIYSGWGNPMKSRYLLGKFFPALPEFYPATLNNEVSLIVHEISFKIYISLFCLYETKIFNLIISQFFNQEFNNDANYQSQIPSKRGVSNDVDNYLSQIPAKRGVSIDPYQLYRGNEEKNNYEKSVMICKIFELEC